MTYLPLERCNSRPSAYLLNLEQGHFNLLKELNLKHMLGPVMPKSNGRSIFQKYSLDRRKRCSLLFNGLTLKSISNMANQRDSLKDTKDYYDVVVIGSGLGGLTGANCLAKQGHSVLLLEHHYQFGGLATWFKGRGAHFRHFPSWFPCWHD